MKPMPGHVSFPVEHAQAHAIKCRMILIYFSHPHFADRCCRVLPHGNHDMGENHKETTANYDYILSYKKTFSDI